MLLVSDFFQLLSYGSLSHLSISDDGTGSGSGSGGIAESGQGKLISYINSGLLALYSRFPLSQKELVLEMMPGITSYYLLKRFAQSSFNSDSEDPYYIADLLNPFQEDVIKVLSVFNSLGREMPLNDADEPLSVFTPQPNLIQVPAIFNGGALSVAYQAKHKKLEYGVLSAKINVPDVLLDALQAYVAWKVFSHMGGQENSTKGNEHLAIYEGLCKETSDKDLLNTSVSDSGSKLQDRGFV